MGRYFWGILEWVNQDAKNPKPEHVPVGPCNTYAECRTSVEKKGGIIGSNAWIWDLDTANRQRAVQELREKLSEMGKGLGECLKNFKHNINEYGVEIPRQGQGQGQGQGQEKGQVQRQGIPRAVPIKQPVQRQRAVSVPVSPVVLPKPERKGIVGGLLDKGKDGIKRGIHWAIYE